jgi:hypothetical protein
MFYYFKDKHKLLEGKLEFKEYNYKFNSYKMELYSVVYNYASADQSNSAYGLKFVFREFKSA